MSERVDQIRKDNTNRAIMELCRLYYNSNFVGKRITDENIRIEGYTRHCIAEIAAAVDVIRSRYGYYCDISFTYDPCQLFLTIDVEERKVV